MAAHTTGPGVMGGPEELLSWPHLRHWPRARSEMDEGAGPTPISTWYVIVVMALNISSIVLSLLGLVLISVVSQLKRQKWD